MVIEDGDILRAYQQAGGNKSLAATFLQIPRSTFRDHYNRLAKIIDNPIDNDRIVFISDMHWPYTHPDTIAFLTELKSFISPTRVIGGGDELDHHYISMHDSDPDCMGGRDELIAAKDGIRQVENLFPIQDIVRSNHGDLPERKAIKHGIPREMLKSRNDMLGVGDGWRWHPEIVIEFPDRRVLVHHGLGANPANASKSKGMSLVQFHYHTKFLIEYWRTPARLNFAMNCGCLIDRKSLAMLYAKENKDEQIIGTGVLIDGLPVLIPMLLDEHGRWIGKIQGVL